MAQDIISDCLNQIMNIKRAKKTEVEVKRYSKFLIEILDLMKKLGHIDYKIEDEKLIIEIKNLNKCRAIKPRYNVSVGDIDKYVRRYLPARGFGNVFISTSEGLMTHEEAHEKNLGGSIVVYVF